MATKTKIYDESLLGALRQTIVVPPTTTVEKEGGAQNTADSHSGLYNTVVNEPRVNFVAAANNMLLTDSTKNVGIVIGSDRPSHQASGYGGKGAQKANTIDLVVGRMASNPKLPDGYIVNNSFSGDAARIYISQMTDIDMNFGLAPGQSGRIKGRSGIGIKADAVRIIGREGVKIVSGRSHEFKGHGIFGESNGRGGKIHQPAPPIELIAGNVKSESGLLGLGPTKRHLQGTAKGENVRDALRELSANLDDIWSAVHNLALINVQMATAMMAPGFAFFGAAPPVGALANLQLTAFILPSLYHNRVNTSLWEINYTKPYGDNYVVSTNVFNT